MASSENSFGPGKPASRELPAFLKTSAAEVPPPSTTVRRPVPGFAIDLLIVVCLAAATFLVYLPALGDKFVEFDDPRYVTSNPMVKQGLTLHGVQWAFTTGTVANWLPMVWLSHMATVSLFGLDPAWHHAVNTVLHALNAGLVFLVLRSMTGCRWPAALAAALFAFHPLRVESVAWVTERKDVLSGLFFLLTLLAYSHYVRRPGVARYGLVLAMFALALMSKTVVVTLPFLLLLLDAWPLRRGRWTVRTVGEKVPLLIMSIVASAWTMVLQRKGNELQGQAFWSLGQRVANADVSVSRYLIKTVWPTGLSPFYPHPGSWPAGAVIASSLLIVGITLVAWGLWRRMPFVMIGWLWFLGLLVPVCGIIQAGFQSMADRYTYLPSIGLSIAIAFAAVQVAREVRGAKWVLAPLAVVILGALAAVSWSRQKVWHSTMELFQDALASDEGNWKAHDIIGAELVRQGKDGEAFWHFQRSAELNPRSPFAPVELGTVLRRRGKTDEAVALFRKAVELAPEVAVCHQWLGLGLAIERDYTSADGEFAIASRLDPEDPTIPAMWALTMAARGRLDRARELAHLAIEIDPTDPKAIDALQKIERPVRQRKPTTGQAGAPP